MHHEFTAEELKVGWRFAIWQNPRPDLPRGGYVRDREGKILRFERAQDAWSKLRSLKFVERVGSPPPPPKGRKKAPRAAGPSAHVCQAWPDDK